MSWMKKHVIYMMMLKRISLGKYFQYFLRRPRVSTSWTFSFLMWMSLRAFRF